MSMVMLCRKMQWTWTEFLEQPQWFVTHLFYLFVEEARVEGKRNKQ